MRVSKSSGNTAHTAGKSGFFNGPLGRPFRAWLRAVNGMLVVCGGLATQAVGLGYVRLPLRG